MSIAKHNETVSIVRKLIKQADMVTIASSPMFIDQELALTLLQTLLRQ